MLEPECNADPQENPPYPAIAVLFDEWADHHDLNEELIEAFYESEDYQRIMAFYAYNDRDDETTESVMALVKKRTQLMADQCLSKINTLRVIMGFEPVAHISYAFQFPDLDDTQPVPIITQEMLAS